MKISDVSLARSVTVFALMGMVTILGALAYARLPREAAPDIKIPFVMVYAPYYGASPYDMENLVTRKIETELKGLADVVEMNSTSAEGVSSIVLEFSPDVEMTDVLQKTRDALEMAKPELPQDVREDLLVYEISSDSWPILQVVISGDYDPVRLKSFAEDLQDALEQIRGVLAVDLSGGVEREVRVDLDPARLRHYGLGLDDVRDAITLQNVTIPGGKLTQGLYDYRVRVPGEFESVEEIAELILNPGNATPIHLVDVADVSFALRDRDSISRLAGVEAVTLSVTKRSGANILSIADEVQNTLGRFESGAPAGTRIQVISDNSKYVRNMVGELQNNILSGMILVVAVLFVFLGFTNSLFVGVAIPLSMLLTFLILQALGFTLNMVVLFSLILALGMLVDNAIVIVENIYRHRSEGYGAIAAARAGTDQVSSAVIASTLTTVSAFLPLAFWPGITGEFMKYLPITVIITLVSSLLVALVFNPVLCGRFMRQPSRGPGRPQRGDRLMAAGLRHYEPVLRWSLGHRLVSLSVMTVLLVGMFVVFGRFNAGIEYFPDTDPTYAYVNVEAPSGTRLGVSDGYSRRVEEVVATLQDLAAFVAEIGSGGGDQNFGGGGGGSSAHLTRVSLEFVDREKRSRSSRSTLDDLRQRLQDFTGAKIFVDKQEDGPPTGKPVTIEISGPDFERLGALAEAARNEIRGIPGVVDLQDNYDRGRPEIRILADPTKAARYGLRTSDIAQTVRTALQGEEVSQYRIGEDEYDIVLRYSASSRETLEDIESISVFYEGEFIPLTAFARVDYSTGPGTIARIDGRRVVTITSEVDSDHNANAVLAEVRTRLADFSPPPGYRLDYTGESEDQAEAAAFLTDAFMLALMLIFLVLLTEFTSVTVPFVILSSVILSLIGVLLGLLVTRTPFGIIMTGVGVISLAGIVVNNAIVLLDYVLKLEAGGMERIEAIVKGGRTRFRPVVLTAITTVLGLIPLTTGISIDFGRLFRGDLAQALVIGGESSQWWGPMGVAVIWGLIVATFLTLVIVPVMYSLTPRRRPGVRESEGVPSPATSH